MATLREVLQAIDGDTNNSRYCYQGYMLNCSVSDARPHTDNEYKYQVACTVNGTNGSQTLTEYCDTYAQVATFLAPEKLANAIGWNIQRVRHYAELIERDA